MAPDGGSSDFFERPTGGSMTAALVIGGSDEVAAIRVLDNGQSFEESLSNENVQGWVKQESSVFKMGS